MLEWKRLCGGDRTFQPQAIGFHFQITLYFNPVNQSLAADNPVLDEFAVVFYFSAGLANGAHVTVTEHKLLSWTLGITSIYFEEAVQDF